MLTEDRNILPGMKPTRHSFSCGQPLGPGVAHHGMRNRIHHHSRSPRQGMLFDMKNRTKARFKGAMRFIKNNEDTLKKDSLAGKLLSKNDKEFWKEIRVMNSSNMPLPNVIDGVTGSG